MEKYQESHILKKEIALKLLTIQDGDCMSDMPDDFIATGMNKETLDECHEMMQQAKN